MIKNLFSILAIVLTLSIHAQDYSKFEQQADVFFKRYVSNNGVNYLAVKTNSTEINTLVTQIESMPMSSLSETETKAFYINSYNLLVIKQVADVFPIKSVMDKSGFFDQTKFLIGGEKLTLNDIENKKIRAVYNDARIHFVLVCGAVSCPPIINKAYKVNTLDQQLTEQTTKALNNPEFIQVNANEKTANVSEIFKWYGADFTSNGKTVLQYINGYRTKKIPESYKQGTYTYNWKINDSNEDKGLLLMGEEESTVVRSTDGSEGAIPKKKSKNLQEYTPSVLLSKGQWEFKSFQNLYTQKGGYGPDNQYKDFGNRATFFSSINQFTYGINRQFNVGVDFWVKSVLNGTKESSPLDLFKFESTPQSRTELSTIGPKIRVNPVKAWEHFAVNSTFLIPIASDQNGSESNGQKAWLAQDAYIWLTQIYYDQTLGKKFQLFFQLAPWYTIQKPGETDKNKLEIPFDIFASYFATPRLSFYMQQEFWPTFNEKAELASYFFQGGLGAKFQLIPGLLELEGSYTNFYYGMNAGAGQTFNFGVRILGG